MNYSEKNEKCLAEMQTINEALKSLYVEGDNLVLGDKKVDISMFDISLLMNSEIPFQEQLTTLTAEDVFKIITLHALTIKSNTPTLNGEKNKAELEALKAKNPALKNITISTKKNEYGKLEEYINIVDQYGKDHLLYNVYSVDLIKMYTETLERYGSANVTPGQLYDVFSERCIEVPLDDTYDMSHRSETSEEFRTKMDDYESKHLEDKHYAVGNEEHDVLISNDHTVTSYERDNEGNLIQKDFGDSTKELDPNDKSQDVKVETPDTLNVNEEEKELEINEEKDVAIVLISQERFYELINSENILTEEEIEQINLFNSYIEDLLVYRDYLLPELQAILANFETVMEQYALATDGELNQNQSDELHKYHELVERKEKRLENLNSKTLDNEIKRLKLEMPEKQGSTSSTLIIIIMSALVMIMGLVAIIITK